MKIQVLAVLQGATLKLSAMSCFPSISSMIVKHNISLSNTMLLHTNGISMTLEQMNKLSLFQFMACTMN